MKRKNMFGFTLIELLAVLVILAVIALIVYPIIGDVINKSKEKAFLRSVEGLEDAAKLDYQKDNYRKDRMYQYENGNFTLTNVKGVSKNEDIKVEGIIENGIGNVYIDSKGNVEARIWNDNLGKCAEKKTTDKKFEITDTVKELCVIDHVTLPIITLKGDSDITITQGETFTDPGYTATYRGVDITNSVQVSGNVDTSVANTYELTYTASFDGKDAIDVTRTVTVVCPFITIMGKSVQTCNTASIDPDQNLRYVGFYADNYVSFNGELWRIIGVFDGQTKIIRNDYYSTEIAYDSSSDDWASSDLQEELNGTYLSSIQSNDPTSYGYIDLEHVWSIVTESCVWLECTRSKMYNSQKSSEKTWTGAIGLMHVSDYGYSTSGNTEYCSESLFYWDDENAWSECDPKSWLRDDSNWQWTLDPRNIGSGYELNLLTVGSGYMFDVNLTHDVYLTRRLGNVKYNQKHSARPVLYLKSNVKIVGGKGTAQEPFELGL